MALPLGMAMRELTVLIRATFQGRLAATVANVSLKLASYVALIGSVAAAVEKRLADKSL